MRKLYQTKLFNTNIKSYYLWQIYLFITTKLAGNQLSFITYIYINLFSLINSERKSSLVLQTTKLKPYQTKLAQLQLANLQASQDKVELWLMNSQQRK